MDTNNEVLPVPPQEQYHADASHRRVEAFRMRQEGVTVLKIARHLGVSPQRVYQMLNGKSK